LTPDWSDWPDVRTAQETDVTSSADKYIFPWILHDNPWDPVLIDWLNQGTEYDVASTFDNGWVMDISDSNYLWLDQDKGGGVWTDTEEGSTLWSDSGTSGGTWSESDKEETTWGDSTKGSTAWQKKDYWQ
jgi:hypothetical protein